MGRIIAWSILIAIPVIIIGLLILKRMLRNARCRKLRAKDFPADWIAIIEKSFPMYKIMPADLRTQLHGLMNVFLGEKVFEGCGGLEITDEMRVSIAAQACVLLLNRKTRYYPKLRTIYVYPHTYVAKNDGGKSARLGESWQNGPVVLAWNSVQGGARNMHDGRNVVMHEFSHRLDQEDGEADGAPILQSGSSYRTWAKVLGTEYDAMLKKGWRRKTVMNKYGATNPAEFFAVATETFFEKAKQMKKKQPELYEELKAYYKLDPLEWTKDGE